MRSDCREEVDVRPRSMLQTDTALARAGGRDALSPKAMTRQRLDRFQRAHLARLQGGSERESHRLLLGSFFFFF